MARDRPAPPVVHAAVVLTALTPLVALSALLAWAIARGWLTRSMWPHLRPVALLLTWGVVADLLRAGLGHWLLVPERLRAGLPYGWPARAAYHAEQALLISWPAALLATAAVVFQGQRTWPALGGWAAASATLAVAYPWLRQERLAVVYVAISLGCCAVAWAIALRQRTRSPWIQHHVSVLLVSLGEIASVGAYVLGDPARDWIAARAAHATAFGLLVCYLTAQIWRYSRWRTF